MFIARKTRILSAKMKKLDIIREIFPPGRRTAGRDVRRRTSDGRRQGGTSDVRAGRRTSDVGRRTTGRDDRRQGGTTDVGRQGGASDDRRRTADIGRQTGRRATNLKSNRNHFFKWQMEKTALYLRISHIETGKIHATKAD